MRYIFCTSSSTLELIIIFANLINKSICFTGLFNGYAWFIKKLFFMKNLYSVDLISWMIGFITSHINITLSHFLYLCKSRSSRGLAGAPRTGESAHRAELAGARILARVQSSQRCDPRHLPLLMWVSAFALRCEWGGQSGDLS